MCVCVCMYYVHIYIHICIYIYAYTYFFHPFPKRPERHLTASSGVARSEWSRQGCTVLEPKSEAFVARFLFENHGKIAVLMGKS